MLGLHPRAARRRAATSSRRSPSRSSSRRTTASSRASTCSRRPTEFPTEPDVMVTFDCGSLGRLGDLEPPAKAARELDRHRPPRLERALRHDQRRSTRRGRERRASCAGSSTSSGSRSTATPRSASTPRSCATPAASSTRPRRPRCSSSRGELVEFDLPVAALSRTLFEEHRFAYLQLLAEALGRARARSASSASCGPRSPRTMLDAPRRRRSRRSRASSTSCAAPREAEVACVLKEERRRHVPGEPALARRRRRPRDRRAPGRRRPPVRGRLHERRLDADAVVARILDAL